MTRNGISPALELGQKFACLALPESRVTVSSFMDSDDGLAISQSLPADALSTWQDNIGRFHQQELSETSLFLWATRISRKPEILDEENETLKTRVYRLYLGIRLAVPYLANGRITSMTGANSDGTVRVRSSTSYHRT